MAPLSQEKPNERPFGQFSYERHQPEATLLYQIIEEYWPCFQTELDRQGNSLPHFVANEFDEYLKCGRLEYGFLQVIKSFITGCCYTNNDHGVGSADRSEATHKRP